MTVRLSTNLRNFIAGIGSFSHAMLNAEVRIYTGAQPATADAAPTGNLLVAFTLASAQRVAEAVASGTVTLAGAAGSVDTLKVNGIDAIAAPVAFSTDLATTAAALAKAINEHHAIEEYLAVAAGAVVTLYALPGTGAAANGRTVQATATTMTATPANLAGGVAGAGGLSWGGPAVAGAVQRRVGEVASGLGMVGGNGGWFRMCAGIADPNTANPAHPFVFRVDGSVGVGEGNGDLTLEGSNYFGADATHTLGTMPLIIQNVG